MSTIKVIPRKDGGKIVCEEFIVDRINWALRPPQRYPTLPSDSAWFEERLGQVVEVEIEIDYTKGTCSDEFAIPHTSKEIT